MIWFLKNCTPLDNKKKKNTALLFMILIVHRHILFLFEISCQLNYMRIFFNDIDNHTKYYIFVTILIFVIL